MVDPIRKLVMSLRSRGVSLDVRDGKLQCRASRGINLSESEKQFIADNAPLIEALLNPEETLPNEVAIPASVPNNVIDIQACIYAQRVQGRSTLIQVPRSNVGTSVDRFCDLRATPQSGHRLFESIAGGR